MSKYTLAERTLLMQMAELRVDQVPWESVVHKLNKPLLELKVLKALYPQLWNRLLADARRDILADANQEMMFALLNVIAKEGDAKTVLKAATTFARIATTQAQITEPPKPKPKPKAKEAKPTPTSVPKPSPTVKPSEPMPMPNAKLPNGTSIPPPLRTAS